MKKRYPFKFLDAYTKADTDIFFGRDAEIDTLYEMVFQTNILLVYGASGTGKTSLLRCGLANRFLSHDWLDLYIRRGNDLNQSLKKTLAEEGGTVIRESEEDDDDNDDWLGNPFEEEDDEVATVTPTKALTDLQKQFKNLYLRHFKPIYLIFDQFEELYVLGTKAEQAAFIETVKEILEVEHPVKMLFVIREEYLGDLYEFEKAVPQLLRKKLRVEPMNLDKVRQVIRGITHVENSIVKIKKSDETQFVETVFEKLKGTNKLGQVKKALTIQLPYLQVFLDRLYMDTTKDKTRQQSVEFNLGHLKNIGVIDDVLRSFLEEQVTLISEDLKATFPMLTEEMVWKFLSPFATLDGTKEPIPSEQLIKKELEILNGKMLKTSLSTSLIEAFSKSRIIRASETEGFWEITHDALAKQIAAKRSDDEIALLEVRRLIKSQASLKEDAKALFSQKQLNFIEPYLSKITLNKEEKNLLLESKNAILKAENARKKRLSQIFGSIAVVFVIMAALTIWAFNEQKKSKQAQIRMTQAFEQAKEALIQKEKTQAAKDLVEFKSLKNRAEVIISVKGCPTDVLKEMTTLAENYPDSTNYKMTIVTLEKQANCEE